MPGHLAKKIAMAPKKEKTKNTKMIIKKATIKPKLGY